MWRSHGGVKVLMKGDRRNLDSAPSLPHDDTRRLQARTPEAILPRCQICWALGAGHPAFVTAESRH